MEHEFSMVAAYDKRPKYGIHGAEMRFYVKGPKGAIQFIVYTNWQLPHVQKETDDRALLHLDETELHCFYHPLPTDLGYHSPVPMYEGQSKIRDDCSVIGGPCYYDGSGLYAETIFDVLIAGGTDALWKRLDQEYIDRFEAAEVTADAR